MPKADLTRTRRIRVPLGGGNSGVMAEVRRMKTATVFWIRPARPSDPPVTGYINPPTNNTNQGSE